MNYVLVINSVEIPVFGKLLIDLILNQPTKDYSVAEAEKCLEFLDSEVDGRYNLEISKLGGVIKVKAAR